MLLLQESNVAEVEMYDSLGQCPAIKCMFGRRLLGVDKSAAVATDAFIPRRRKYSNKFDISFGLLYLLCLQHAQKVLSLAEKY